MNSTPNAYTPILDVESMDKSLEKPEPAVGNVGGDRSNSRFKCAGALILMGAILGGSSIGVLANFVPI
jgi:hypothetical protein